MFASFAAFAVAIGCLGLIGLSAYTAERRTKEIGIRKALGARGRDIMLQFLVESGAMAGLGGALGLLGGFMVAQIVTLLLGFPSSVALWSVLLGIVMSVSVGVFFGVYPAYKAAKLDPIVALRAEL
jgi:putative ABC transport system permease protein